MVILTLIDLLSEATNFIPLPKLRAICCHGIPVDIVSD